MELIEYLDREVLTLELAQIVCEELATAIRAKGSASLCLPGGSTPAPLMSALSAVPLDWEKIAVFPGDERCVPEDHTRSNARLIRRHLMEGCGAAATLVPLYDPAEPGAEAAGARLAPYLPISSLVLGMGNDLHTASLFPHADGLEDALSGAAGPVALMRAPDGEERLSLTVPTLRAVPRVHVLILGSDKREALDRAANLAPLDAPIRALWPDLIVHWAA